jgi:transcriptional regulator with XRE-family HTH domain
MSVPQSWPDSFGAALKRYRRRARMTQEALASATGYTAGYISLLELGERLPPPEAVAVLADALDLSHDQRAALDAAAHLAGTRPGPRRYSARPA